MSSASNLINSATGPIWSQVPQYNQQNIDKFMSPYTNDVVDAAQRDMARTNATQQQQEDGRAVMSGAFGGSGAQAAKNNLAYSQAQGDASTLANLRNSGFNNAQQGFMNQQGLQLGAIASQNATDLSGAGMNVGMGTQNLSDILSQAAAQGNAGTVQQGLVQQQLNIPYQQFQQQQAYPYQQLQYFSNLASGVSGGAGGTSSGTGTVPGQPDNTFGNIVGAGLGIAGLFSDERVKYDIKEVGKAKNGLPIYTFKYKGDATATTHMGFIAQEVEKKHPGAVGEVGGIKTVNYDRAAKKDGGTVKRTHMASGGIAPSILEDPSNSYIPSSGFAGSTLNVPGMMSMPGQGGGGAGAPSLESMMMSAGGQKGMAGLGNLWDNFSGNNALGVGGGFDPIMNDVNAIGNANSGIDAFSAAMFGGFKRGGIVRGAYAGGGTPATGGAVTTPGPLVPKTADTSGTPVTPFDPVVPGTPVYAFNPMTAAGNAVTVPTKWDAIGGKDAMAANAAATSGDTAGKMSFTDWAKYMSVNPQDMALFGENATMGNTFGRSVIAGPGGGSMLQNYARLNPTADPSYHPSSGFGGGAYITDYNNYLATNGKYGFKRGGIVRGRYDIGGQVGGIAPPSMMSTPPGQYGMNTPPPGAAFMSAYGMIPPGTGTINPSTVAPPDTSSGPMISAAGGAPGGPPGVAPGVAAHLSAPPPMNLPAPPASPEDQISGQVDQARRDLAAAMSGQGIGAGGAGPIATPGKLNPTDAATAQSLGLPANGAGGSAATQAPDSGSGGGILGKFRTAMNDPARAAMIMGGLSMMGQHGPNASTAGVISRGLMAGIGTYASVKGGQVTAEQKALELAQNAERYKELYDSQNAHWGVLEEGVNSRLKGVEDQIAGRKDVADGKHQYAPFEATNPDGTKTTKFYNVNDPNDVVDAGSNVTPMAKRVQGGQYSDQKIMDRAITLTNTQYASAITPPTDDERQAAVLRNYDAIKNGAPAQSGGAGGKLTPEAIATLKAQAADAIKHGAPAATVNARLKSMGVPVGGP